MLTGERLQVSLQVDWLIEWMVCLPAGDDDAAATESTDA